VSSSNNTILKDRILWFDGDSTVESSKILNIILKGGTLNHLFVDEITNDIKQYNQFCEPNERILIKTDVAEPSLEWNIPLEYQNIDIIQYISDKLVDCDGEQPDFELRQERCASELALYKKLELFDTLKVLIYIVSTLNKNNVVWGVGRGSSVSSYVLYLIGIHDIDSFYYKLNITDFLRSDSMEEHNG